MSNLREKLNKFIRFFSNCQHLFIGLMKNRDISVERGRRAEHQTYEPFI